MKPITNKPVLNKNDRITITITGLTAEGSGVGREQTSQMAVFVPGAAVGDILLVHIVKVKKNYAFGKIAEILSPSPDRITVDCPQYSRCGGCVYRHINYSAELTAKQQRVQDAFTRIGGFENFTVSPIVGAKAFLRYRNKAQLPVGEENGQAVLGFYSPHSHRIVPCESCLLQPKEFDDAVAAFKNWLSKYHETIYNENTNKGKIRHFYLRKSRCNGEVLACLVVNGNGVSHEYELSKMLHEAVPSISGVLVNRNTEDTNVILGDKCRTIWGKSSLTDTLCNLDFSISPLSFYQVNPQQTEVLYTLAAKKAKLYGEETLLDLYCGTGTIGLSMASKVKKLIGVEIVPSAVEDARKNAAQNHVSNAEFLCMDAAKAAYMLQQRGESPDVIIVDPPRKGCSPELLQTMKEMSPSKIIYVSCDPATLARDAKILDSFGYSLQSATPVDMFPRTAHVETVCLMSKKDK